jgi:protease-4
MVNPIDRRVATALQSYTVLVVAALLIGAAVVPFAVGVTTPEQKRVAVVQVNELITDATSTDTVQRLRALRSDDSVVAVVLRVSSPGGFASASEAMYLAVNRLAEEKPVVTSVGRVAASGAYYTAIPSDSIYVTPASIVGHVGVIGRAPSEGLSPQATTGPDKSQAGVTRDQYYAKLESMKRAFVGAVMDERGDRLSVSRATVAEASAFGGARAVENGYADEIGGLEAAIAGAAAEAGVTDYEVRYYDPAQSALAALLNQSAGPSGSSGAAGVSSGAVAAALDDDETSVALDSYAGVDTVQFLMVYGVPEDTSGSYNTTAAAEVTA